MSLCDFAIKHYEMREEIIAEHKEEPDFDITDWFNDPCEGCLARIDNKCPAGL